jgi:hypothetical protein
VPPTRCASDGCGDFSIPIDAGPVFVDTGRV